MPYYVRDVLQALDDLSGGRCLKTSADWSFAKNPFVVTKTSHIPGKSVTETPGLVWGDPDMPVKKVAVMMTMTESAIELAAATGVNVMIAHHPIADAANSGGVLLKYYLSVYGIAAFELHEAFHGLHPGIPFLHGHKPTFSTVAYDGIPGNIVYIGDALPGIETVDDLLNRLDKLMHTSVDEQMLEAERKIKGTQNISETSVSARAMVLVGDRSRPVKRVIHMFPHTGFTAAHLEALVKENPDVDTLIATISRVYPGHELIAKAEELGLNLVCGNSHALEIFENGLPLAYALKAHMPEQEIVMFRERVTSTPLEEFGSLEIRDYAQDMSSHYLSKKGKI
ncbi:Nif3-like dinuclear metal center hexameric protein [Christensenellaceae bacterium OttesenSCG-928-L17]|nr:Nif3-like dinuclear metal center hexameric protein [Christensenellaceae bacterium OttesenSCG-928-L17]